MFPLPDSLASTGGPGASSASLSSLQGSSADVIQLPVMTAGQAAFFKEHERNQVCPLTFLIAQIHAKTKHLPKNFL